MERFAFLDFEASGLQGFPIEVGWAIVKRATGQLISSEAHLIRPMEEWLDPALWSVEAERIHGITLRNLIDMGRPADNVAARVLEALDQPDLLIVADSIFDGRWLQDLLAAANRADPIKVADVAKAFEGPEIDEVRFHAAMRTRQQQRRPHRAEADALEWAQAYAASWRKVG